MYLPWEHLLAQMPTFVLVACIVVAVIFLIHKFILGKKRKLMHYFWFFLFLLYLQLLYEIVIGEFSFHDMRHRPNIVPFADVLKVYSMGLAGMMAQILLNILIMMPLGFLIPMIFSKCRSLKKTCLIVLGASVAIEVFQYFIGRRADIDDVIMNSVGGVAGYICFRVYGKCEEFLRKMLQVGSDQERNT